MTTLRKLALTAPLLALAVALTGCEEKGPAQKAGEAVDRAAEKARDAVTQPGPAEKAGRAVDRATDGK